MVDIARLAIGVDSRQLRDANAELIKFRQVGTQAEVAAAKLSRQIANDNARQTREFVNAARDLNPVLGQMAGAFTALRTPAGAAALGIAGVTTGLAALSALAVRSIQEFSQLEQEQARYTAVLRATGYAAGKTADDIDDLGARISKASTLTGGEITDAAAQLLTFRSVARDTFDDALQAAADLSATGFGTVASAAVMMGKAIENPVQGLTALRRVGVSFGETQERQIIKWAEAGQKMQAARAIIKGVQDQVGGAAAAQGNTLAGAWNSLTEAQNNWFERTGAHLARMTNLQGVIRGTAGALNDLGETAFPSERGKLNQLLEMKKSGADRSNPLPQSFDPLGLSKYIPQLQLLDQIQKRIFPGRNLEREIDEQSSIVEEMDRGADMRKLMAEAGAAQAEQQRKADDLAAAINKVTDAQEKYVGQARLEIDIVGKSAAEQMRLRTEYELTKDVTDRSILSSQQFAETVRKAAVERAAWAEAGVRRGLQEEIQFQQQLIGLTDQQVRIVERLRDLYGNDIPAALKSTEAAQLRQIDQLKTGTEALAGAFSGISRDIRTSSNLGEALMNRTLSLGDRIVDAQIEGFIKNASAPGGMLNPLASLLGGALTPQTTATMNVNAGIVNVGGGMTGSGVPFLGGPMGGGTPFSMPSSAVGGSTSWPTVSAPTPTVSVGGVPYLTGPGGGVSVAGGAPWWQQFRSGPMAGPNGMPWSGTPVVGMSASTFGGPTMPGYIVPRTQVVDYIQQAAALRGIDPNVALRVAQSEGLNSWRSAIPGENSFGPYQLYTGGGLGNTFQRQTGLDPSNPAVWRQSVDFSLDQAATGGWGPFHGAANTGISRWQGLQGARPMGVTPFNSSAMQQETSALNQMSTATTQASTAMQAAGTGATDMSAGLGSATQGLGSFQSLLSSFGSGGGGGGGLFSGLGGLFGSPAGGQFTNNIPMHTGGIVGSGTSRGYIHAAVFADAARFHSGGITGFRPDEVPIIAQRGEEVLTEADPRHRRNRGRRASESEIVDGQPRGINVALSVQTPDAESILRSRGMIERQAAQAFARARSRHM